MSVHDPLIDTTAEGSGEVLAHYPQIAPTRPRVHEEFLHHPRNHVLGMARHEVGVSHRHLHIHMSQEIGELPECGTRHGLSLSRLNYQWPECEVHPEMMEGIAARNLCLQRGLKG